MGGLEFCADGCDVRVQTGWACLKPLLQLSSDTPRSPGAIPHFFLPNLNPPFTVFFSTLD